MREGDGLNEERDSVDYMARLVDTYSDMILRLALTYLRNIADAQDVCQDVFIKIYSQRRTFNDSEHEKAWILRVTINRCKDLLRSPWRRLSTQTQIGALPIQDPVSKEVVSLVLKLPQKYRVVIYLFHFENYSTAEIANLLSRNENTIRTQLKRARKLLKKQMLGGFDDEEYIY